MLTEVLPSAGYSYVSSPFWSNARVRAPAITSSPHETTSSLLVSALSTPTLKRLAAFLKFKVVFHSSALSALETVTSLAAKVPFSNVFTKSRTSLPSTISAAIVEGYTAYSSVIPSSTGTSNVVVAPLPLAAATYSPPAQMNFTWSPSTHVTFTSSASMAVFTGTFAVNTMVPSSGVSPGSSGVSGVSVVPGS